jgi:hypothetical protein
MKTIEQVADEYVITNFHNESECDYHQPLCNQSFRAGVAFAQQWIRVENELPEYYRIILFRDDDGYIYVGCRNDKGFCMAIIEGEDLYIQNITHWRPIELK